MQGKDATNASPDSILLNYFRLVDNNTPLVHTLDFLVQTFKRVPSDTSKCTCLAALLLARESAIVDFRDRIGRVVVALILNEVLPMLPQLTERQRPGAYRIEPDDAFEMLITSGLSGQQATNGPYLINVDWTEVFQSLDFELPSEWQLLEALRSGTGRIERFTLAALGNDAPALKLTERGGVVMKFFNRLATAIVAEAEDVEREDARPF